jgi:hypothetical protein
MSTISPLPVAATAMQAVMTLVLHRRDLVLLATPNIAVMSLLNVGFTAFAESMGVKMADLARASPEPAATGGVFLFLVGLLAVVAVSAFFLTCFCVAWLRRLLIPEQTPTVGETLAWRTRHTRFLLHWIGLVFVSVAFLALVGAPLAGLAPIVVAGVAVMLVWVLSRLSLMFAADAVEQPLNFRQVWKITRGKGHAIFGILLLTGIVAGIPSLLVRLLAAQILAGTDSLLISLVAAVGVEAIGIGSTAALMAAIAILYRHVTTGGNRTVAFA